MRLFAALGRALLDCATRSGSTGQLPLFSTLTVQLKKTGEDLVPDFVRPPVAVLPAPLAVVVFLPFVLELREEVANRLQAVPPIAIKDRTVHAVMQSAQLDDLVPSGIRIVKLIIGCGQAASVLLHDSRATLVVSVSNIFQGGVGFEVRGEWKGLKAIGRRIQKVVL